MNSDRLTLLTLFKRINRHLVLARALQQHSLRLKGLLVIGMLFKAEVYLLESPLQIAKLLFDKR